MSRYFRYLLLSVFVATVLLIVFLQFNSNRSINKLIDSNEVLLNDFDVKESLQHLTGEIIALESKVSRAIISGAAPDSQQFQPEINSINTTLQKLDTLAYDEALQPLIADLRHLVNEKMNFSNSVLQVYRNKGKPEAEKLVNAQEGKGLADSIRHIIVQIDRLHQASVTQLIREADREGLKARTMGTILAAIAVIAAIFTFAYVVFKVRQQQKLISRLNISEKNAKEAAHIKENFLANMSHEIRTPLNAILGYANLLQRKNLDEHSKEHIQTIQRSGENLLAIINDVLDLSKIEAGMMRIESAPFSIRGLLQSVETMFQPKAAEKHLRLTAWVQENLPDTLEGDPVRLTQILVNLVGNAIKFTVQGGIDIEVLNYGMEGDTVRVTLVIRDTGIGIKPEKLNTIFERFEQAEDSVTRKYGGTGLGLAIVHELVTLQQGSIKAESEEGKGTTFTITIPYKISSQNVHRENTASALPGPEQPMTNVQLLVVEDNSINQSLMQHLLSDWQMQFDIAANGQQALDMLAQKNYDLILMDIQMPMMDGYTATRTIRDKMQLDIPIIAMTAHAMAGEREKCLGYGMNEYISKPIREEQLYKMIARFTNGVQEMKPGKKTILPLNAYRYIDLRYMQEISLGNNEYEKAVTGQFIESIPEDLTEMQEAWQQKNIPWLRRVAHNMKTSISVMGLNVTLDPYLDQLEYNELDETAFTEAFTQLQSTCHAALEEARHFYTT